MTLRYKFLTLASVAAIQIASLTLSSMANASVYKNFEKQGYSRLVARAMAGIHPNFIPAKLITRKEEADVLGEIDFLQHRANKATGMATVDSLQDLLAISATPLHILTLAEKRGLTLDLDPADRPLMAHGLPLSSHNRTAYHAFVAAHAEPTRHQIEVWLSIQGPHQESHRCLFAHGVPLVEITDDYRAAYAALSDGEGELTYETLTAWAHMPEDEDRVDNRELIALGSPSGGDHLEGYRILRNGGAPLSALAIQMWVDFIFYNR